MRISSAQYFREGLHSIQTQQRKLAHVQNQLSTGKKVNTPSDDPVAASQVLLLKQQLSRIEDYQQNATSAQTQLELEESVVSSMITTLQRVRELQLQGSNGTLDLSARNAIAVEVEQRLDEIVGLANSQDESGRFLFTGYQNRTTPVIKNAQGKYDYVGDDGQRALQISPGVHMKVGDPGSKIFADVAAGNGNFKIIDSGGTNTGSTVVSAGSVFDKTAYVQDTYTVSFVTNGNGDLAYQVVGATSGQVIPALPATIPNDAPAYNQEQSIIFNGIEIATSGQPQVGDDFQIIPSTGITTFNTMENLIQALRMPEDTETQRAARENLFNQTLSEIDNSIDKMLRVQSEIGLRLNIVETSQENNDNLIINNKKFISSLEDADMTELAIEISRTSTALEAVQQGFLKIQSLSLLNYLR